MIFPKKSLFVLMAALVLSVSIPHPSPGQLPDYTDLDNLTGLRSMANTVNNPQSGMEVGNVDVPSLTRQGRDKNQQELLPEEKPSQPMIPILFDTNKLDPTEYTLGPDDVLNLYLFGQLDKEYALTVLPEGTVNIPTVGAVDLGGKKLSEAKDIIEREVRKKYKGITLNVTLSRPRYFRVFISGMVRMPGAIETHALQRVSDVVNRAGLTIYERMSSDVEFVSFLQRASSQRTIVIHRQGKDIPVDLQRFNRFGDLSLNPYVCAGDRIDVPPYVGSLFIYGQVNEPKRHEFKPGDRVLDLIQFSGGLTTQADTTRATLTRFDVSGKEIERSDINLYDALILNPDAPQYKLQEADRLNIWPKYQFKQIQNVSLRGQVKYPGTYPITPNQTTLYELIEDMAQGFTENANLEEAVFVRPSTSVQDLEFMRLSKTPITEMTDEEVDLYKNMARSRRGEISVDMVKLFRENDRGNDILLQDGDQITIPVARGFVHMMGAVQQPGFTRVEPGKKFDYYLGKAGGYNWNAHKSKTRLIKARTGQRFRLSQNVKIEAGDTIQIPEKKPVDFWGVVKDGALVFANVATVIILARQLTQ